MLVKSSDPIELSGLCDRVVVMSRGRIVDEIPRADLGEHRIISAIVGRRPPTGATMTAERPDAPSADRPSATTVAACTSAAGCRSWRCSC